MLALVLQRHEGEMSADRAGRWLAAASCGFETPIGAKDESCNSQCFITNVKATMEMHAHAAACHHLLLFHAVLGAHCLAVR